MNILTCDDTIIPDIHTFSKAAYKQLVEKCGLVACTAQLSGTCSFSRAIGRRIPSAEELQALATNPALVRLLEHLDQCIAQRYITAVRWKAEVYIRVRTGNEGTPVHQDLDHYAKELGKSKKKCTFCSKARSAASPVSGVCQRCEGGGLLTAWLPLVMLQDGMPLLQLPDPYTIKQQPQLGQCLVFTGEVPHQSRGSASGQKVRLSLDVRYLCRRLPPLAMAVPDYICPQELDLLMQPLSGKDRDSHRVLATQRHGMSFLLALVGLDLPRWQVCKDVEASWKRERSTEEDMEDTKIEDDDWLHEDNIHVAMDGAIQTWMQGDAPGDTLERLAARLVAEIDTRPAPRLTQKNGALHFQDEGLMYLATHVVFMATGWLGRRPAELFWKRHVRTVAVRNKIECYLQQAARLLRQRGHIKARRKTGKDTSVNLELFIEVSWCAWAIAGEPEPVLKLWNEAEFEAEARRYSKCRHRSDVLMHCRWLILWQRILCTRERQVIEEYV